MQVLTPRQLTRLYRAEQLRLAREGAAAVDAYFPLLDPHDVRRMREWGAAVAGVAFDYRARAAESTALYLSAWGRLQGEVISSLAVGLSDEVAANVHKGFRVTGPVAYRTALKRHDASTSLLLMRRQVMGAAIKAVMDGGRDQVRDTVHRSPRLAGWRRRVSPDACDFCIMHAGRGAVFSAETATFAAHNNCSCVAEPALAGAGVRVEVDPYVAAGARKSTAGQWLKDHADQIAQWREDADIYA